MRLLLSLITVFVFMSCSKDDGPAVNPLPVDTEKGKANVWLTTGDQSMLLSQRNPISITNTKSTSLPVITIDSTMLMQVIEGFGASLTGCDYHVVCFIEFIDKKYRFWLSRSSITSSTIRSYPQRKHVLF